MEQNKNESVEQPIQNDQVQKGTEKAIENGNQKIIEKPTNQSPTMTDRDEAGSTFGKFKDATSLLSAYENLQAEFTRKSQKLSEFEKQGLQKNKPESNENSKSMTNFSAESNVEENLDKTQNNEIEIFKQKQWRNEVNKFFAENPEAKIHSKKIGEILLSQKEIASSPNALQLALKLAEAETFRKPADLAMDDDFLKNHIFSNEKIKKQIIDEYVSSLNLQRAPKTISGGGSVSVAAAKKYTSFEEAGITLLKSLLKKE